MAEIQAPITTTTPQARTPASRRIAGFPASSLRFDLTSAVVAGWFLFGLFLDGWAHNHGKVDDTFFTPWHAVLYSGVLAVAAHLCFTQFRNVLRGYAWQRSLPRGYGLSLAGVTIFFAGGGFDFVWHSWFGFEANVEALLSPAHLFLATGAFLFIGGPLRSGWARAQSGRWADLLPVVIGLFYLLSLLTFFTQYAYPFANARTMALSRGQIYDSDYYDVAGIASLVFWASLTVGLVLLTLRRWRLPPGSLFLILSLNALLMFWMRHNTTTFHTLGLIAGVMAGVYFEGLYRLLRLDPARPVALRLFAFGAPFLSFVTLFALLLSQTRIAWSIHMWLGSSFSAAIAALFLSYVVFPPRTDTPRPEDAA